MRKSLLPLAFVVSAPLVHAQEPAAAPAPAPAESPAVPVAAPALATAAAPVASQVSLAASSDIAVTILTPMKSGKAKVGHIFKIVTAADTMQDGVVVIPKGTEGLGRVTFSKGGGSFGKSGQMEVAFTSLTLNGETVPLQGKYREQAEGNGGAAVGATVAIGLVGGFLVHGHSVEIPAGKVMHAQNVAPVTLNVASKVAPNEAPGVAEPAPATSG